ncbi:MAG TPA: ATP-binding protein [Rubrobacteraceae bacterium]|nr:ATP-binding protein [Rubrobacteraceae bacterium]
MNARVAAWLAPLVGALGLVLSVAGVVLVPLNGGDIGSAVTTGSAILGVAFSVVGAVIVARRPENLVGRLLLLGGLFNSLNAYSSQYPEYAMLTEPGLWPLGPFFAWLQTWVFAPGLAASFPLTLLLFPTGRLPSPRWQPLVWLIAAGLALAILPMAVAAWPLRGPALVSDNLWTAGVVGGPVVTMQRAGVALLGTCVLASVVAVGLRFRRSAGEERQQLKWLVYAGVLTFFVLITSSPAVPLDLPETVAILALLCLPSIPVAVGIAILRNRLYDIDLVINRTLVYGALTACVVGIYVVVVGYLGALFSTGGNVVISLAATGVVAVLFQPLRERLQRAVNRLMYGERDEPYAVLTRLGERLEATVEPRAVLPAVVETVAQALKVPHAAIELRREGGYETAAEYGMPSGEPLVLALTYQNEAVGRLVLSRRTKGESFTKSDLRLLEDLARQVGVAAHAVRLTADLQRSRERLVTAREEERRRLRRDLHDGVGPQLAALTLKIETARNRLAHDPDADVLLSDLAKRARDAVADVRRAVHALRPPTLDELGLVPALRETAAQYEADGLSVSVESPEEISALPAAVEVAAYRIAQEAMTNAVRHAGASRCQVRFDLDEGAGLLRLEISDDGRGIGEDRGVGVGLSSMRERAEELGGTCVVEPVPGGGTRVRAELPWRIEREPDA